MKCLLFVVAVIIIACSPSETAIQAAIAETEDARPTETAFPPTDTPAPPTATIEPTNEPIPLISILLDYPELVEVDPELATLWEPRRIAIVCQRNYVPENDCESGAFYQIFLNTRH